MPPDGARAARLELTNAGGGTAYFDDVFVVQPCSNFESVGRQGRVDDHLDETRPVAEIDKDQAAVVAYGMDPALQDDTLSDVFSADLAAHHVPPRHGRSPSRTAARSVSPSTTMTLRAPSREACVSWPFRERPA